MDHPSVTVWLSQFKQGDQSAAKKLWDRYGPLLTKLARRRYHAATNPVFDEDDLVQSVFGALWSSAASGKLENIQGRDELWWLLLSIMRRKASNRLAYNLRQKRGGGRGVSRAQPGSEKVTLIEWTGIDPDQPPPDLILALEEEQQRLLNLLRDDTLRSIAMWQLDGYTHEEIACKLTVTPRTIIRKVNLIRERWAKELDQ